jgi:RHS repeat-associated protein
MPGDVTTTKTYDPLGRLATVTNSGPGAAPASTISSFAYTVDAHDRRTRVDLADGAAGPEPVEWGHWDYTYDAAGQLTGGTRYGPKLDQQEGTLVQYAYQYDAMGNPTHRSEDAGVSAYTYNNLNQLVTGNWSGTLSAFGWTGTSGLSGVSVAAGQQQQAATVFQNGDWTAKGLAVPAGDTTLTVTRTAADQTTAQAQSTVTRPAAATQFTHDLNGNMLGEGQWQYTWDDENRLAAVTPTGATAASRPRLEYVYDGLGRRRIRRVFRFVVPPLGGPGSWQLQSETRFLWDSWLLLRETTVTPADGQTFTRTYTCGLDLSGQLGGEGMDAMATAGGIGGILACSSPSCPSSSSSTACFLYDGNGNVANLVDAESAAALAAYEYSPFGNTVVALGPLADTNPIRFSSKYAETTHLPGLTAGPDLYYYGFRYYSPGLGRWVSRDPIGESGGPGLYLPGHNSVVRDVDPLGEVTLRANGVSAGVPFRPGPGAVFSSGLFPPIPLFGPCAAQYQNVTARILLLNALSSPGLVDAGPPMYGSSWPHQHCVWNCRMTRRVGGVYAYVMSELKEQLDNAWCDLRDLSQSCGDYCGFDRWFRRHLHNQCNSASQPCDYGRQILRCGGDRNWRGDAACEDCCTRRGVGPGTEEGGGTIRPFGPRSRRSPCPGDDAVHGFRL